MRLIVVALGLMLWTNALHGVSSAFQYDFITQDSSLYALILTRNLNGKSDTILAGERVHVVMKNGGKAYKGKLAFAPNDSLQIQGDTQVKIALNHIHKIKRQKTEQQETLRGLLRVLGILIFLISGYLGFGFLDLGIPGGLWFVCLSILGLFLAFARKFKNKAKKLGKKYRASIVRLNNR